MSIIQHQVLSVGFSCCIYQQQLELDAGCDTECKEGSSSLPRYPLLIWMCPPLYCWPGSRAFILCLPRQEATLPSAGRWGWGKQGACILRLFPVCLSHQEDPWASGELSKQLKIQWFPLHLRHLLIANASRPCWGGTRGSGPSERDMAALCTWVAVNIYDIFLLH